MNLHMFKTTYDKWIYVNGDFILTLVGGTWRKKDVTHIHLSGGVTVTVLGRPEETANKFRGKW